MTQQELIYSWLTKLSAKEIIPLWNEYCNGDCSIHEMHTFFDYCYGRLGKLYRGDSFNLDDDYFYEVYERTIYSTNDPLRDVVDYDALADFLCYNGVMIPEQCIDEQEWYDALTDWATKTYRLYPNEVDNFRSFIKEEPIGLYWDDIMLDWNRRDAFPF